jgi:hypothetical protein
VKLVTPVIVATSSSLVFGLLGEIETTSLGAPASELFFTAPQAASRQTNGKTLIP